MAERPARESRPGVLGAGIIQLLIRNPASGYDLKKRFQSSVGHGWHAYDTQIYRELKALEDGGYVVGRTVAGRSGPERRLFTVTDLGREALVEWLVSPIEVIRIKDEFGLRLTTADLFRPGDLEAFIDSARRQWAEALEHQRLSLRVLIAEHGEPDGAAPATIVGRQLSIDQLISVTEARIAWADRALKILANRAALGVLAADGERPGLVPGPS